MEVSSQCFGMHQKCGAGLCGMDANARTVEMYLTKTRVCSSCFDSTNSVHGSFSPRPRFVQVASAQIGHFARQWRNDATFTCLLDDRNFHQGNLPAQLLKKLPI